MIANNEIKQWALDAGFDAVGLTAARALAEPKERFGRWLERGYHSSLGYLARNIDKRFDPQLLMEGAQTVIVCAVSYKNAISGGYPADARAKIASYACNRDYHTTIKEMLFALLERIRAVDPAIRGRAFVDSAPLCEKQLAVEAGLGWIGRQSLLIHPELGSFLHLGELVITAAADRYDRPSAGGGCGDCRRCIEACPNGAILDEERMIDTARCIACHTIEEQPAAPIALDGWIFGCDACQNCCPYNRIAPAHRHPHFTPRFDPRTLSPSDWRTMEEELFRTRFGMTPLLRSGLKRIQQSLTDD